MSVDLATIIGTLAKVIKAAVDVGPDVIKGVADAKPFAEQIVKSLFRKEEITIEELVALENKIDDLAAQLQEPLPEEK